MKTTDAAHFTLVGFVLLTGPAVWPWHFTTEAQEASALWLYAMGGLQFLLGGSVLTVRGYQFSREVFASDLLDFGPRLADVHWVLPPEFYALLEDPEDILVALSLQRQLRPVRA